MNKLLTSTLLTITAVPFLMAAPHAAKKTQNTTAPATNNKMVTKKAHKKHVKKSAAPVATAKTPAAKQ